MKVYINKTAHNFCKLPRFRILALPGKGSQGLKCLSGQQGTVSLSTCCPRATGWAGLP